MALNYRLFKSLSLFQPLEPYHGRWRELEVVAHRDDKELKLWFEIDRNRDGARVCWQT
ncbi:sporulation protein [Vibrio chagasii]|nr:sporulation protein [Vibrio chagasii]